MNFKPITGDSVCRSAAVCAFTSVPADGCMLSYTCTSGWEVPIVEIVCQCPWPLCMIWANSADSMSKFIISPQITLCRPERAGKACLSSIWAASMILSVSNPVGLKRISLSLSNRLSSRIQTFLLWLFIIFFDWEGGWWLVLLHIKDDRFLYHFPLYLPPFWHHLLHPSILLHHFVILLVVKLQCSMALPSSYRPFQINFFLVLLKTFGWRWKHSDVGGTVC